MLPVAMSSFCHGSFQTTNPYAVCQSLTGRERLFLTRPASDPRLLTKLGTICSQNLLSQLLVGFTKGFYGNSTKFTTKFPTNGGGWCDTLNTYRGAPVRKTGSAVELLQRRDLELLLPQFTQHRFVARVFRREQRARTVSEVNARTGAGDGP